MELPNRKRLPHEIPSWVSDGAFFFLSVNCQPRGHNHLCKAGVGDRVLDATRFYHTNLKWHCRLMLLMPDHLHAIVAVPRDIGLRRRLNAWKRYLTRKVHIEWQRDFFDHRLRTHHALTEKTSYILMNPVRRGLCERVEEWPWFFRGDDRIPPSWLD